MFPAKGPEGPESVVQRTKTVASLREDTDQLEIGGGPIQALGTVAARDTELLQCDFANTGTITQAI